MKASLLTRPWFVPSRLHGAERGPHTWWPPRVTHLCLRPGVHSRGRPDTRGSSPTVPPAHRSSRLLRVPLRWLRSPCPPAQSRWPPCPSLAAQQAVSVVELSPSVMSHQVLTKEVEPQVNLWCTHGGAEDGNSGCP